MRKVLVISYYWPPSGGSGVQRWVKFAKYLPAEGWMPVIYTPENPELIAVDESLGKEVPAEVEVIRRHIVEPYSIFRKLTGAGKKKATDGQVNAISSTDKSFKKRLALFVRGNFFIPDPRCWWIRPSARFLKKYLREHPVDLIVSTGPPQSMHLIARKVALATGIPWIADFRDPWTKLFYFKHLHLTALSKWMHRKKEASVLRDASLIVAVSPKVRDEFMQMTSTPVALVTNGYDEDDTTIEPRDDGFFNLTHTGLFAAEGDPDMLWELLADKCAEDQLFSDSLRIRLVGKTDAQIKASIVKAGLADKMVDLGYRSHSEAVLEQKSASLLILPLRKEPESAAILPGKLFEYLASRRPVMGIDQSNGAMAEVLRESGAGECFEWNDKEGMRAFIDECWDKFRAGTLVSEAKNIEKYSRRSTARAMAELMNQTSKKQNG